MTQDTPQTYDANPQGATGCRRWLLGAVALLALVFAVGIGWVFWAAGGLEDDAVYLDAPLAPVKATPPASGQSLKIMTWNMAYARGPGWAYETPDKALVESRLDAMAEAVVRSGADVIAIQEIDLGADRSAGIDQVEALKQRLGWHWAASVTTWRVNHLPWPVWPISRHMGRIVSGQAVLSRFPIVRNVRRLLPQPRHLPPHVAPFHWHRAVQWVQIDWGGRTVDLFNAHLESRSIPNKVVQAAIVGRFVKEHGGAHTLILGDLNTIPRHASVRSVFADNPQADFSEDGAMHTLRAALPDWTSGLDAHPPAKEALGFTFPATAPNRRLDHALASPGVVFLGMGVLREETAVSDHLPVVVEVRLRSRP